MVGNMLKIRRFNIKKQILTLPQMLGYYKKLL